MLRKQQAADERKTDTVTPGPAPEYDRFQILALAAQAGEPAELVVKRATAYEKFLKGQSA